MIEAAAAAAAIEAAAAAAAASAEVAAEAAQRVAEYQIEIETSRDICDLERHKSESPSRQKLKPI